MLGSKKGLGSIIKILGTGIGAKKGLGSKIKILGTGMGAKKKDWRARVSIPAPLVLARIVDNPLCKLWPFSCCGNPLRFISYPAVEIHCGSWTSTSITTVPTRALYH